MKTMIHITQSKRVAIGVFALIATLAAAPGTRAADYQKYGLGTCANTLCTVDFSKVPGGKVLRAGKASCYLRITNRLAPIMLNAVQILLINTAGQTAMAESLPMPLMAQFTPPGSTALNQIYESNESIQITATAGQHLRAFADVPSGEVSQMACHVSGTLTP